MKKLTLLSLFVLASCAHHHQTLTPQTSVEQPVSAESLTTPKTINEAVNSGYRSADFKVRDMFRHPEDTLTFFGVKPSMTVLEILPSTGWYTEILAPYLNDKGQYIMTVNPAGSAIPTSNRIEKWSAKFPMIGNNIKSVVFDLSNPELILGAPASVDMVLTFRNVHNWMAASKEDTAFKAFFNVLKKGGILGVVEHRAPDDRTDPLAPTGYVRERDVIRMAKKAGFKYAGKSDVNKNSLDTKDYEKGVWTLPPTLALKDQDREKYIAIGESDRMTLKFIKP